MSILTLPVPEKLDLPRAVCSYGYFLLAPNRWDPDKQRLRRWHALADGRVAELRLSQSRPGRPIRIVSDRRVSRQDAKQIRQVVARTLRFEEDFSAWRKLHPRARRQGFDRLFRSASLFEDIVKTITGCNVSWPNTMRMNKLLCLKIGRGAFPTPQQIVAAGEEKLRICKTGYRAPRLLRLAQRVVSGELDLARFEDPNLSTDELFAQLRTIDGVGPYAAGNLCQLLGRYDRLAIDTETIRHFKQVHHITHESTAAMHRLIEAHYARFAPYQFLAYWFELWEDYQRRVGDARTWHPDKHGPSFTASVLRED